LTDLFGVAVGEFRIPALGLAEPLRRPFLAHHLAAGRWLRAKRRIAAGSGLKKKPVGKSLEAIFHQETASLALQSAIAGPGTGGWREDPADKDEQGSRPLSRGEAWRNVSALNKALHFSGLAAGLPLPIRKISC